MVGGFVWLLAGWALTLQLIWLVGLIGLFDCFVVWVVSYFGLLVDLLGFDVVCFRFC